MTNKYNLQSGYEYVPSVRTIEPQSAPSPGELAQYFAEADARHNAAVKAEPEATPEQRASFDNWLKLANTFGGKKNGR